MPSEVRYPEVRRMLEAKGFRLDRVRGSHHVFEKPGAFPMIVPVHHGKVKYAYVRKIEKLQ
jgi:predicted RNA binding protein YcfA (HicA-like mRNA interferase family)